jgi:hypothetical protein
MRKVLGTSAVVAVTALIALLGPRYGAVGQYYGTPSQTIVAPGDRITLTESRTNLGFTGGTDLFANFFSHQNFLGQFTANSNGTYTITVTIPTDATAGSHRIRVSDTSNSTVRPFVDYNLTVSADDLPETGRTTSSDVSRALAVLTIGEFLIAAELWFTRRRRTQTAG